ncbi:hypothetical protein BT93_G0023 [Corymbia citriodora subsp. variegata]|nr:hypothetical protein BT93_G0023 [Corymbia citriodora subsp. variegata]
MVQSSMADELEMFFFPFMARGHQIPMIDLARLFASLGVKSTIVAAPDNAHSFRDSIARDRGSGRPISIHPLDLPRGYKLLTDTFVLQDALRDLLIARRPDCIVADTCHRWSADVIDAVGVPRIVFNGYGCFSQSALRSMRIHRPPDKVDSEYCQFEIPGLPDTIEMTKSQLPHFHEESGGRKRTRKRTGQMKESGGRKRTRQMKESGGRKRTRQRRNSEDRCLGVVVNSFLDLEPAYVEYFKKEMAKKAWVVGPVSLCNRDVEDKAERGQRAAIDEQSCLSWLNAKEPNSVLYVSFGSLARLTREQLLEIAYGLEASSCSFIWAVGKINKPMKNGEGGRRDRLQSGLEKRLEESKRGLIIRGWAPQLLILEHPSVGGYMTHCGWNSTLEGVSAGVPMVTFPHSAEQFFNEKLITDVLGIGVQVGSMEWTSCNAQPGPPVGRRKVEEAVRKVMDGGEKAAEMRRRAKELGEKAERAFEEGGSSYEDAEALIQELKSRKKV